MVAPFGFVPQQGPPPFGPLPNIGMSPLAPSSMNVGSTSLPTPFPQDLVDQSLFGLFGDDGMPDLAELNKKLLELPPDPTVGLRPRPTTQALLERKRRIVRFWRPRNIRMAEDERAYKMQIKFKQPQPGEKIGASQVVTFNDLMVLVDKLANMIAGQEMLIEHTPIDPGMKEVSQKVETFCYWFIDKAEEIWGDLLNNTLAHDELHYLALRGWVCGRILLDPGDSEFPFRYDLIDPMTVYPQKGAKGLNWVFHVYRDSKVNVLNDLGWDNDLLNRIETKTSNLQDTSDIEVAEFWDDVWHVLFINDVEVWSAPHNYGFVPYLIRISFGPPIRRTDSEFSGFTTGKDDYTAWWGVSVFQGIKDVHHKLNQLASAVMTEVMKGANPPVVVYTNPEGEAQGKVIDTGIGGVSHLLYNQEKFEVVNYGFKPEQIQPIMQMLVDARNRGSLPAVMYGENANYLSGFAVNLLQAGSRDVVLPLVAAHESYRSRLLQRMLRLIGDFYPYPVSMVGRDDKGERTQMTTIKPEDIRRVGYTLKAKYRQIFPKDQMQAAMVASTLVDKQIIDLDTARGPEFIGLKNPVLVNRKVLADQAYKDPAVIQAAIPIALLENDPFLYVLYKQIQAQAMMVQQQQMQLAQQMAANGMPMDPSMMGGQGGAPGGMPGQEGGAPPAGMPPGGPGGQAPTGGGMQSMGQGGPPVGRPPMQSMPGSPF